MPKLPPDASLGARFHTIDQNSPEMKAALWAVEAMNKKPTLRKIHFEDQGQDFLWFNIDDAGMVQDAGPFQGWLWAGKTGRMTEIDGAEYFQFTEKGKPTSHIRYRVTKTETVEG